jgi:hypothetical protein
MRAFSKQSRWHFNGAKFDFWFLRSAYVFLQIKRFYRFRRFFFGAFRMRYGQGGDEPGTVS